MSSDSDDVTSCDSDIVSSTARSTPSIMGLRVAEDVYEHSSDHDIVVSEGTELDEGLVPYSQTSEEEETTPMTNPSWFKAPSTDFNLQKLSGKTFSAATEKKILWATKLFMEWRESRLTSEGSHSDIFKANFNAVDIDPECLSRALCCFLNEVHHVNGEEYPGNTLYSLVIMLQLFFEKQGKQWKLLEGKIFHSVRNTLDNLMKARALSRISKAANSSDPISVNKESKLWDEGILGEDEPDVL